jgi:uncharacterized protein (TIGR02466 family)
MTEENNKKELIESVYFGTPIYHIDKSEWLDHINEVCDEHINEAKKRDQKIIEDREKEMGKKIGDIGLSYHSYSIATDERLSKLRDYFGHTSRDILDYMGYDLTNYSLFLTEMWVQEFAKHGGGHHSPHIHYDNHISGFYYLKCSEKTSYPVFHDPRPTKLMSQLPLKNENNITLGSDRIYYKLKPGSMIFTPAYVFHEYVVDYGIEPFRFIHFNLQAIRKMILNTK